MSEVTYPVDAATLAQGSCPSTYQELADLLASIYSVTVNTNNTGIVVSATKPTDTTLVWKQLDSSGNPVRDYVFVSGLWLSRHTIESGIIVEWDTALPNFTTFDGGDADPLSDVSGPMWEEVTALRAKFPLGVGTLPSGTAVAVGDTGGEEKHTLTIPEIPSHSHDIIGHALSGANQPVQIAIDDDVLDTTFTKTTELTGGSLSHNTMPPFYTVYFLRRTSRKYFAVA